MSTLGTIRRALLLSAAGVVFFGGGCASEREQRIRKFREVHRTIRETDGGAIGDWELKEKSP